jgi:hypothetical protein
MLSWCLYDFPRGRVVVAVVVFEVDRSENQLEATMECDYSFRRCCCLSSCCVGPEW